MLDPQLWFAAHITVYDGLDLFCCIFTDPTAVHRHPTLNLSENITHYSSWQHQLCCVNQPKQGSKRGEQLRSYVLLIMQKKKM